MTLSEKLQNLRRAAGLSQEGRHPPGRQQVGDGGG